MVQQLCHKIGCKSSTAIFCKLPRPTKFISCIKMGQKLRFDWRWLYSVIGGRRMDQARENRFSNTRLHIPESSQSNQWQRWGPLAGAGALAVLAASGI